MKTAAKNGERERDDVPMDVQVATVRFDEEGCARARVYCVVGGDCDTRTQDLNIAMPATSSTGSVKQPSTQEQEGTGVQVMTMDFSSDQEKEMRTGRDGREDVSGKVSEITRMFESSNLFASKSSAMQKGRGGAAVREGGGGMRVNTEVGLQQDLRSDQKASSTSPTITNKWKEKSKTSPPPVASKPKMRTPTSQGTVEKKEGVVTDGGGAGGMSEQVTEFDYITRTSGQLFHVSEIFSLLLYQASLKCTIHVHYLSYSLSHSSLAVLPVSLAYTTEGERSCQQNKAKQEVTDENEEDHYG